MGEAAETDFSNIGPAMYLDDAEKRQLGREADKYINAAGPVRWLVVRDIETGETDPLITLIQRARALQKINKAVEAVTGSVPEDIVRFQKAPGDYPKGIAVPDARISYKRTQERTPVGLQVMDDGRNGEFLFGRDLYRRTENTGRERYNPGEWKDAEYTNAMLALIDLGVLTAPEKATDRIRRAGAIAHAGTREGRDKRGLPIVDEVTIWPSATSANLWGVKHVKTGSDQIGGGSPLEFTETLLEAVVGDMTHLPFIADSSYEWKMPST